MTSCSLPRSRESEAIEERLELLYSWCIAADLWNFVLASSHEDGDVITCDYKIGRTRKYYSVISSSKNFVPLQYTDSDENFVQFSCYN